MEAYKQYLKDEADQFYRLGKKFLDGDLTRAEFKGKSGGMGCYAQRDGKSFMIRLRTPAGVVSREHFKLILSYAESCGLERIHITTRQAVQLHDLNMDQVRDVMKDAIDHNLFTRGGGGNFPRNVSLSPMAGVDPGESFDTTPYALMVSDYFVRNATTYRLPRKLKVAFSSGPSDTAFASINDLGFMADMEDGKPCFRLWAAGGMGGGPAVGIPLSEAIRPEEVLYYVEAMVRLFAAEGDYENKARARIRFIPRRMGVEAFLDCYRSWVEIVRRECRFEKLSPVLSETEVWEAERFAEGGLEELSAMIHPQRQAGRYTVVLHPSCGQLELKDAKALDVFLDTCEAAQLRLSMLEDLYVRNLTAEEVRRLLKVSAGWAKRTNVDMSVSCVGTPTCQMGILQSQALCHAILDRLDQSGIERRYLPRICISGCPNSCARHQMSGLGFAGRIKPADGERLEMFECFLGGKASKNDTHMGERVGMMLKDDVPEFVEALGQMLAEADRMYDDYIREHMDNVRALAGRYVK